MIRFKLEELLKEKGMTMYHLSKASGVRPNTISQWVNNNTLEPEKRVKSISTETLESICTVLDCEIGDVIEILKEENHHDN
ncbi:MULTISPECIES: helix-turn-helix transcriptional regulator [unclassified Sutcliffiella]|uniref:helix-turn-helix domain-containing protein n=1 Tax=unclassified Sutcliffiella TaxID=2837532 RepID=UPI0030D2043E